MQTAGKARSPELSAALAFDTETNVSASRLCGTAMAAISLLHRFLPGEGPPFPIGRSIRPHAPLWGDEPSATAHNCVVPTPFANGYGG